MCSPGTMTRTRARALAQGANDYLVKLPPKDDLIACIRRHTVRSASRAEDGPRASDSAVASLHPDTDADETLDLGILAAFRQVAAPASCDFTRTLIDLFLREAASQVEILKDAGRRSDRQGLEATAHSLKGSSMTIGAKQLAALCARVEAGAAGSRDGLPAEALLAELDREFMRVRDLLTAERYGPDPA